MTVTRPPSPLDRAFFALVTCEWNTHKIARYESTLRKRDKEMAEAAHTFVSIDDKATGLLTHTSMMIAGLGLIALLVADSDIEVGIVIMEMAIYLLIALGCLRCLSVFQAQEFEAADPVQGIIHRELIIRNELYSLCIRSAIVFTIVVFALLPVLYFWTSEKPA
jgi:NADH:ubiquinone oxidoreductase subunit 2 (subunit N)